MPTVPLKLLRPGHEATPPINARTTHREADIESLAAMIAAQGLINDLSVVEQEGFHYVAAGNRRLLALRWLRDNAITCLDGSVYEDETLIAVKPVPPGLDPLEISQAENFAHLPPHPADQYETFSRLAATMSAGQIAAHFGVEEARVRRFLALGSLSPVILDAWRNDVIPNSQEGIGAIRLFTMASHEEQERVFAKVIDGQNFRAWKVREELGLDDRAASRNLRFIGREPYEAAGGRIVEDLFGDNHRLTDPALAKRLADEKLAAAAGKLRDKGWSWAEPAENLPSQAHYSWNQVTTKSVASKEDKGRSGCIVSIDHEGRLAVKYGVVRPEAERKAKAAAKKTAARTASVGGADTAAADIEEMPALSAALFERLTIQMTQAVQRSCGEQPMVAVAALGAGILAGGYWGQPVHVSLKGHDLDEPPPMEAFRDAFARLYHLAPEALFATLGHLTAGAIHMVKSNPAASFNDDELALVAAFEPRAFMAQLRAAFDFADYCKAAPKAHLLQAVAEAVSAEQAKKLAAKPKAALAEFALANIRPAEPGAWLPPLLRTVHYDGPTAPATAEAAEAERVGLTPRGRRKAGTAAATEAEADAA